MFYSLSGLTNLGDLPNISQPAALHDRAQDSLINQKKNSTHTKEQMCGN